MTRRTSRSILGMNVDVADYDSATRIIADRAERGDSGYVCVANVHMVMETVDDSSFRRIVNEAFFVSADGTPLVWMQRLLGSSSAQRVYGPDLVLHLCDEAERRQIPVALYGGTPSRLTSFQAFLAEHYPSLRVSCAIAPPFRPLTEDEDRSYTRQINESGARIVFVGIGCPKQERWMHAHRQTINAVQIGVGAAFDFHSGAVSQAPSWIQRVGLEWLYRLIMEPRRLWKRYLKHNPRFVVRAIAQLIRERFPAGRRQSISPTESD